MIIKVTSAVQDAVRNMRKQKGIRGDDLSREVGKSPSFISRLETGKTKTVEDTVLFSIFKVMMQQDDDAVQEFINLFIDIIPESGSFDIIDSLPESKKQILSKFLSCLEDERNSFQFFNCILQAIELSNNQTEKLDDDTIDIFTSTLATTMYLWKRRKKQEREEFQKLRESIPDYDELF